VNEYDPKVNPYAFPNPHRTDLTGMTLMDYFAAKAMQALVSLDETDMEFDEYAGCSYAIAFAMLKERYSITKDENGTKD
jgi:hypothetical protein